MRKAMKAVYDAVRKANEAANERGTRRGVKGLFEKQKHQQEAQARRQAERREEQAGSDEVGEVATVEAGVPGDMAGGGSPSISQEGPRAGHRSEVKRSLQEEWESEEEPQGRVMEVQCDTEAGVQN